MININSKIPLIGIYKITSPSNKIYIGQSINIKLRKGRYKHLGCKKQPKLYNSLIKYSWEQHIFEIIEECLIEQLNERESFWKIHFIELLGWENCLFCEIYDRGIGGPRSKEVLEKIGNGNKGKKLSEETKKKISNSRKGIKFSKEHKDKLSILRRKRIISKETGDKISKSNRGRKLTKEQRLNHKKRSIPIIQYDLNMNKIQDWPSAKEASLHNKPQQPDISACCHGKLKTAGGYIWKFKNIINGI